MSESEQKWMEDPSWLRWNFIEKIANNELSKLVVFIPIAGYLILFNDRFAEALTFDEIAGVHEGETSPFFLSATTKLRLAFFGGIFVFVSKLVFVGFSPKILENFKRGLSFAETVVDNYTQPEIAALEQDVLSEAWIFRTPHLVGTRYTSVRSRKARIGGLNPHSFPQQRRTDFREYIQLIAREWWHGQMHSHFFARLICLVSGFVGFGMLSFSTLDIAQAVIRDVFS